MSRKIQLQCNRKQYVEEKKATNIFLCFSSAKTEKERASERAREKYCVYGSVQWTKNTKRI